MASPADFPPQLAEFLGALAGSFLERLSTAALRPEWTQVIFCRYEHLFVDLCGRWILSLRRRAVEPLPVLSAIARVLPYAPHLAEYADEIVSAASAVDSSADEGERGAWGLLSSGNSLDLADLSEDALLDLLLTTFRLLDFDNAVYARAVAPSKLSPLLQHPSRPARYLAIRVLRLYLHAADSFMETVIHKYLGDQAVEGQWEGKLIDYAFLTLWEEKRLEDLGRRLEIERSGRGRDSPTRTQFDLSPLTADVRGCLLPRLRGPSELASVLVPTSTTVENMRALSEAALSQDPVLITGLAGSGKTAMVSDLARELGADRSMLTLHLNEQTDAKLLVGMYTTASTPGSFVWRAGVLTTAVREGRWVLIEDLDRAPTEVLSVVLPLLERRELLIPSREEVVRAARTFKIFATMRASLSFRGEETLPGSNMLGGLLWRRLKIKTPSFAEIREILSATFPLLRSHLPMIMNVYSRVQALSAEPSFVSKSKISLGRPLTLRDILKWCRRIDALLRTAEAQTGSEPVTERIRDDIFKEAADCLAGSLQTEEARTAVTRRIGEEMHFPPSRVEHFLQAHEPRLSTAPKNIRVGRTSLEKSDTARSSRKRKSLGLRPFAPTPHTLRLLEKVAVAVNMAEPVLLVGETGTGKTTVVQQLAEYVGQTLTVVNLSQQSEGGDLLGGFKPIDARTVAMPLKDEFDDLFDLTFSSKKNQRYLDLLGKSVVKGQWTRALTLWKEALTMSRGIFGSPTSSTPSSPGQESSQPKKRRRLISGDHEDLRARWGRFEQAVKSLESQLSAGPKNFAFKFVEGNIVRAARKGEWVLLDEINLASPDTLESIADLVHNGPGGSPSILLSESGDIERIRAHPNFRIFGAMNPATDVGKKDLPMGLRSGFTEFFVESPDRDLANLLKMVEVYLKDFNADDRPAASDVARLHIDVRMLADQDCLVDGANQRPHFSLRTLTRTLTYVADIAPTYGLRRALYEGFSMSLLTVLDLASAKVVVPLIDKRILGNHRNVRALLGQVPRAPLDGKQYVQFEHYWMLKGDHNVEEQPHYIITPFVRRNMLNLIRATSTRRFPVLIQGPTSSGKTSMIEYLAKVSGNKFVRINNHEHTDLQEYLGMYTSGEDGQLRFQEGILVQALREGSWVVLDELNLAPTDVLEALNRLLDDNRELLIPETQTIVRPHPNFMLFATQNPPGLYGGRKILSRAFRNRFLELHFDDIPDDELETILRERTQIAPSFCTRIVAVYKELSLLRQSDRVFEQRNSFATLRDLFRWALRDADDKDQLAANGFMLLAERVRKPDERLAVKQVIEKVMRVKIDEQALYSGDDILSVSSRDQDRSRHRVEWTKGMRRLYTLVYRALEKDEPVLLVGETGSGKTTVSQLLAENSGKQLYTVNAHQNTETGDLIGAHRPVRNRAGLELQLALDMKTVLEELVPLEETDIGDPERMLYLYQTLDKEALAKIPVELAERIRLNKARAQSLFQWTDGALVQAMKQGQFFLLDEISLADDSVLERLNSVLETSRSLVLAEKGPQDSHVKAAPGFQFLATMNPGGDYGKRELSPALRNRFTEIWVPAVADVDDVIQIAEARLSASTKKFATPIVRFARWFGETFTVGAGSSISIRDVLAWVNFIKTCDPSDPLFSVLHGAAMVYIDTLGASPAAMLAISADRIQEERRTCLAYLAELLGSDVSAIYFHPVQLSLGEDTLSVGPFSIATLGRQAEDMGFNLQAPTTRLNAMRVIRALKARKPILLEGSPGVGKTTLITALARAIGKPLTRINLSEQTDLMDLFGSDVPLEGAEAGHFVWRNAAFLQAMQKGHWVLLDEMNLASQSVLEGLNACLDHRGEVYVSELDQTFTQHPDFVVFATQNPHHQGGGRKGLPSSFVNRFTVVYADVLAQKDLVLICRQCFPEYPEAGIESLLRFVSALEDQIVRKRAFGSQGGPWEFNLRDVLRWLQLLTSNVELFPGRHPVDFLDTIFTQRFRTAEDRVTVRSIFHKALEEISRDRLLYYNLSTTSFQVGLGLLERDVSFQPVSFASVYGFKDFLPELESVMICIQQNWPVILVGPSGSGKTSLLKTLAAVTGADLVEFAMNSEIDTMDLIGGYEQIDRRRQTASFWDRLERHAQSWATTSILCGSVTNNVLSMLKLLRSRSGDRKDLMEVYTHLSALSKNYPDQGWSLYVTACEAALQESEDIGKAQFEWIDGILVRAMQKGKWLVLDNANICSSSVLDRLNSLLEPDGFLSMDEHRSPEGDARKIRPHSNFRIFITMDPRHGELSRAMRNRAVELFMAPRESVRRSPTTRSLSDANTESQISRYRMLRPLIEEQTVTRSSAFAQVAMGHLSLADHKLLRRWEGQMAAGMMDLDDAVVAVLSLTAQNFISLRELTISANKPLQRFYQRLTMNTLTDEWAQPVHPLVNAPLLQIRDPFGRATEAYDLAFVQELLLRTFDMALGLNDVEKEAQTAKMSQMSRLVRSQAANRIPKLAKDSTGMIYPFLNDIRSCTFDWARKLSAVSPCLVDSRMKTFSEDLVLLWWSTFGLVNRPQFDEAEFQEYLTLWKDLLTSYEDAKPRLGEAWSAVQRGLDCFSPAWKLSTGISMGRLWVRLRPKTAKSSEHLEAVLQIEKLASRFDSLIWGYKAPLDEKLALRESVAETMRAVWSDGAVNGKVLENVEEAIAELEANLRDALPVTTPYFEAEFEGICQHYDLLKWLDPSHGSDQVPTTPKQISLLARRPTERKPQMDTAELDIATIFSDLSKYAGVGKEGHQRIAALRGTVAPRILRKISKVGDATLRQLDLLQTEADVLSSSVSTGTACICIDQLHLLSTCLSRIIQEVFMAHEDGFDEGHFQKILDFLKASRTPSSDSSETSGLEWENIIRHDTRLGSLHHIREIVSSYLAPSIEALSGTSLTHRRASKAWVSCAVGVLLLFVPNRPFDPALKPFVERRMHVKRQVDLEQKLDGLQRVELEITGQHTNLRCVLVEETLKNLGNAPPSPSIFRPQVSHLGQLQGEFSNLLNSVVRTCQREHSMRINVPEDVDFQQEAELVQQNISQIRQRITQGYRAYDDITGPVVGLLQCLDLGLSLEAIGKNESDEVSNAVLEICNQTPMLGGRPKLLFGRLLRDYNLSLQNVWDARTHYLQWMVLVRGVEGLESLDSSSQLKLMRIFHSFYDEWKENLARDQEDAAAKTGLYRYRGGQEEDEEADQADFAELFPDFETAETTNTGAKNALRSPNTPSSHLAGLHRDIFIGGGSPSGQIMTLLQGAEARVEQQQVQQATATVFTELNERLLPRLILALGGLQDSLSSTAGSSANGNYNFYTDANLTEARKLVEIAHKVIHRFAQLQEAWPEHATLQDVLTACDELLDFRHVEPVAKFLTKVEKVHGYIYEWQVVASKEFSALGVYEDLTALIVSWRRLELSTWTRLFDIEDEKCKTDAMAWWSIAYEVVIAAPLSISESGAEVKKHSVDLLAALETFFTTTTLGQYSQRVRLLKQFLGHSLMIAQNVESMSAISDALSNFIEFYSRFESQIDNVLQRGRRALEKEIKDVVLLASWKDTNINALRESAKRSHHKLFKLVRKYRALLGQSAGPLLAQGLQEASPTETAELSFEMITPSLNTRALEICQNTIPGWPEKPTRLVNIYSTLGNMRRMSRLPNGTLDGAEYLESFSGDLIASIEALQKETPTRLTDENKDKVKHLKSRKRKLFADTLRELRQMGFKHNLGANVLAEQADIPTILAKAKPFPRGDTKGALGAINSYFHRVVDLMPRLRQTLTNHSEELTGAEMTRSTGYIEGMLLELLKQHDILAASLEQFSGLDVASQKLQNLWADGGHALQGSHSHVAQRGLRRSVQWLPRLLELGHRIIGTQDKLGGVDNSEVQQVMKTHMDALTDVARRSRELPTTPKGTSTSVHASLQSEASAIIAALRAALAAWSVKYPQLAFMTNQVLPWVDEDWAEIEGAVSSNEKVDGRSGSTLIELDRRLSRSCDSILVALQKMQGSASTLPSSTENAAWLLRLEKGLATSLKELRAPEITSLLEKAMDDLALVDLSEAESALAAAALSAMAAPIVRQYAQICRDAMQKYADLHRSSCKTVYILAKSFHQIATQGFCTPSDESSTADGKEKLEEGTGLGEGQGAEDISRDIQDDEDLSELAQEPNTTDEKGDIEDEKDAVDIQDEMEGETEDGQKGEDEETGSGEEEQDEVDEEAGSVNDLDPTAVDEKLWDGDGEEAEKDQEGHESKGKTDKDEQAAAEERKEDEGKGQPDDEDEIEEGGVDEEEQIGRAEPETTDPQAPEEEALDLPEDMDLDGDEKSQQGDIDDDGMEDLSDVDDGQEAEGEGEDMDEEVDDAPADLDGVDSEAGDTEGDFEEGEKTQDADPDSREEEEGAEEDQGLLQERTEDVKASGDDVAASEMQGVGDDQEQMDDEDKGNPDSNAQRSEGAKGNPSAAGKSGAEERETGDAEQNAHGGREEEESLQDTAQTRAFKKLGDALERWHRKQKKIHPASEEQEKQQQEVERDGGEFEHLQDEEAEADTQALGAATEEQANALDESMGMDSDSKQMPDNFVDGEAEGEQDKDEDVEMEDNSGAPEGETSEDVRSRAIVGEAGRPGERVIEKSAEDSPDENMDDTSQHLSTMQLSTTAPAFLSEAGARALWSQYEASTRTLSQTLTEQLRLILHPSVATKLRGDFRTGKRLNIKRIIPYIASQYRRDKIWLRRATPHKRAYQILLAVDDSSSMAEHSAGHRALETLVMVARSLTMLEAGQMAVVAFGSTATIAHAFETPFSHDAGAAVLRHFGFKQSRTDVRALLQSSLALFREARARPGGASEELWQLQFIISDGLSEDREAVARLVREALRERIMIVFLIVDPSSPPEDGGKGKGKSTSIMAMTSASFDADGTVKVSRYLDGFPFPYYIVVGDVRELPGVLAGALRGWFGEIVGEGG